MDTYASSDFVSLDKALVTYYPTQDPCKMVKSEFAGGINADSPLRIGYYSSAVRPITESLKACHIV